MAAAAAKQLKMFKPFFDRVLVEKFVPVTKTKAGIMIPEKSAGTVMEGTVISVGPGSRTSNGTLVPVGLKPGDHVVIPEYGGTKVAMNDKDYFLFREPDILGKLE